MASTQPIPPSLAQRGVPLLVAGDTLAFLLFAAIGRLSHGQASGLDTLLHVAGTATPFAAGWFAVAPFLGAFRPALVARPGPFLARTALAWLVAWPLGLLLRAIVLQRAIPLSFALVTFASVLVILAGWRALFALARAKFGSTAAEQP
jgi:hypothetical protein